MMSFHIKDHMLLRIIQCTLAGVVEFRLQHRFFIDIFPRGMLATLIDNNPSLQALLPSAADFRNGLFRASSIFVTPLSFGEFEIIAIPIGLFFALHRENLFERMLGWAVVFGGFVGIYVSGSRGGWVGVLLSLAVFVTIWSIRQGMKSKASLAPAIAGLMGGIAFATILVLITASHAVHDMVLGGAAQAGSTDARYGQWIAAIPFIKSNPVTGHGFQMGGLRDPKLNRQLRDLAFHRDGDPGIYLLRRVAPDSGLVRRSELSLGHVRNWARRPARWPVASSRSPPTDLSCRRRKITC